MIVERGSHSALLQAEGVYAGMWAAQVELEHASKLSEAAE
jgi:ABC-type multidrug transport system fused ATPase/permease subunit